MKRAIKEIILLVIAAIPVVAFLILQESLPDQIPTHFKLSGEADGFSTKSEALYFIAGINIGLYLLMLFIPKLDPKEKVLNMGNKYYSVRLVMTLFIAAITGYIIYAAHSASLQNPNILLVIIGVFLALIGNYFQVIRQNYFIGIRTPWTLENEVIWTKTHRLSGKIWVIGGILIAISALFINAKTTILIVGGVLLSIMILAPIIHSYLLHKQLKPKK